MQSTPLFIEQLAAIASQLNTIGMQGVQPQAWDSFLGLLCSRLRQQGLSAAVKDCRELEITVSSGNAVFSVSICGRLHQVQFGPSNVPFQV
jgi:hypothetical protein